MFRRTNAVIAVGVVGALVCVGAAAAGAADAKAAGRATMTFTIGKAGKVKGPGTAAPGRAEMTITGAKHQLFQIAVPRAGAGKTKLIKDDEETNNTGSVKDLENDFRAIGGAETGNTLVVHLHAGVYYALDIDAKKPKPSMILAIHVSGPVSNSPKPVTSGTITSVGDMKWSKKHMPIAASGLLKFRNHSEADLNNTHFIDLEKLKKGKSYKDVKMVFMGKEKSSAVFATGKHTSFTSGIISNGRTQVSSYTLKPGIYMLACFFPDRANGQPHAFMGMYRTIHVG